LWGLLFATGVLTLVFISLHYVLSLPKQPVIDINGIPQVPSFTQLWSRLKGKTHLVLVVSALFLLVAWRHYLARYAIMYSKSGIVVGAGYTDVHVYLPAMTLLVIVAALMAVVFLVWLHYERRLRKRHVVATMIGLYLTLSLLGSLIVPAIVQSLVVSPNELKLEQPYIEHNIAFTREAYGLNDVAIRDFTPAPVTRERLDAASPTVKNIRLLDWRPLTQTYKQTQEIRLYYDLSGIDIDRYVLDGELTQVMIAPRELDQQQIAEGARTWVNLHQVYTHGFGAVVSPVNKVTTEGLPVYLVKDIPPQTEQKELEITEPRIYYGERQRGYVVVNTGTEEFDYPRGDTNAYTRYSGTGGVVLDSFLKKLFFALRFSDVKLLLSNDITRESRILFHRNIQERIATLAPFLTLDRDPYLVIDNGRLVWVQDAYTTTGHFPYSARAGRVNYLRNAVKVVVDAYDGSVTFYVVDDEPLIKTYSEIFPGTFKPLDEMSPSLRAHLRYPQDLFEVQARIYSTYHMDDPTVFYNKEDAWQFPSEIYGTGERVRMDPYYIIMDLDGPEFVLMMPFTPIRKDNMIAWFAARSDGEHYGELTLYQFPKDELVYGPSQIEAKIDQDSEISQQLTLWSQQGSRVTRGNLLVIPVQDSLLYVEPLYIQAETGQLPQLKRVIVSDGERVVMEESFGEALDALFGKSSTPVVAGSSLVEQASTYYDAIQAAMRNGDWAGIGENLEKLGEVLENMK
ncbi:UPF0182 family protein, partial [Candidatus Woesearchaeota archaeon]